MAIFEDHVVSGGSGPEGLGVGLFKADLTGS